jgi:predicted DNA-binding antitoxin AbrB/MazE fold protein
MHAQRTSPRTRCRLHCRIRRRRSCIRARLLEMSTGGFKLLSPVELRTGQELEVEIELPGEGPVKTSAVVRHVVKMKRKQRKSPQTWLAGMQLQTADEAYLEVARRDRGGPAIPQPRPASAPATPIVRSIATRGESADSNHRPLPPRAEPRMAGAPRATDEPLVFRVRARASHGPRIRMLKIQAANESEAREAAVVELAGRWIIEDVSMARPGGSRFARMVAGQHGTSDAFGRETR